MKFNAPVTVVARASTAATLPKKVMRVLPRWRKECMEEEEEEEGAMLGLGALSFATAPATGRPDSESTSHVWISEIKFYSFLLVESARQ